MSKMSKEQINKDEKKIIIELKNKATENLDVLARRCGFSRQKVWRIVKRLEHTQLIWGYTAIIDEEKNDLHHYTLLIKRTPQQLMEKTVNIIASRKIEELVADLGVTIESSYYVHGDYDWVLTFTAKDIIIAKKFCGSLLGLHQGVIEKTTLLETLFMVKNHYVLNPKPEALKAFL
jgi:DNA-binding Lrp family transcriptional regulator